MAQATLESIPPLYHNTSRTLRSIVERVLVMFDKEARYRILNSIRCEHFYLNDSIPNEQIATFILLYIRWNVLCFNAPVHFGSCELSFPSPSESLEKSKAKALFQELLIYSKYRLSPVSIWTDKFHQLMDIVGKNLPSSPLFRQFTSKMPDEEIYRYFCRIYNKQCRSNGDSLRRNLLMRLARLSNS